MPFCRPPNLEPEQQQMDLQCCSAPQGSAHVCVSPYVCVCVTTPVLTSGFYQNRRLWVIMAGPGLTSNAVMDYGLVWTLVLVCVRLCLCESGHLHSLLTFPSFLYISLLLFISPSLLLSGDSLQRLLSQQEKSQPLLQSGICRTLAAHRNICFQWV